MVASQPMSMTQLLQFLRLRFGSTGEASLQVDEMGNGVVINTASRETSTASQDATPIAQYTYRDGKPYLVDTPSVSESSLIQAIKDSRDEQAERSIAR
jgi:hypothetical protein